MALRQEEPTPKQLIAAVKAHALEHYNDGGWDVIVEGWGDDEIGELLEQDQEARVSRMTEAEAIQAFQPIVDVWADRQADARQYRDH